MLRALFVFVACVALGTLGVPFVVWASAGFPGGDSHGLWIPVILGPYIGLPAGVGCGLIGALIVFFVWRDPVDEAAAHLETSMRDKHQ